MAAFRGDVAPEEQALDAEHRRALQAGDRAFRAIAVGDEAVQQASLQRYHDQVSSVLLPASWSAEEISQLNLTGTGLVSDSACIELVDVAARLTRGTSRCGRGSWRRRRWRARSCSMPRQQK